MIGLIKKPMGKEPITNLTEMSTKVIFTMTNNMEKVKKCCMITVSLKEIFIEVKDKVEASLPGLMEVITRVSFAITKLKEKENTGGRTDELTRVNGKMARWMVKGS